MLVSKDTTYTGETNENDHKNFESDTDGFTLDVVRKNEGDEKENCSNNHDMTRGEGGLTGTVGAGIPDEDFVENKIGDSH